MKFLSNLTRFVQRNQHAAVTATHGCVAALSLATGEWVDALAHAVIALVHWATTRTPDAH